MTQQLGIDWDGPLPSDADSTVILEPLEQPISDLDYHEMTTVINPLGQSTEYGMNLYLDALTFTYNKITMQANHSQYTT